MIRHLVGAFETEHLGSGGAGHAQFLDDRLILPPRKNSKSITTTLPPPVMLG